MPDAPVPAGVRELIAARTARLLTSARAALPCAAVIGRDFEVALLQRSCGLSPGELLDALGEAATAGLIHEIPGVAGRMHFSHAITRDAIYGTLSPGERAERHHQVAVAMESFGPGRAAEFLEQLAHHYAQSALLGDAGKAGEYARLAGDRALDALAFDEAAASYQTALRMAELQPSPDPLERFELLL